MRDADHWAQVASEWIAWARAANHDAFWAYREALRAFVGTGRGEALDVGCGEGRVSRELTTLGYDVTAADPVPAMLAAARAAKSAAAYALAPAAALPFPDARFDLAVAYNVLMDIEDISTAVREIRRVLRPRGRLVISIVHPFTDQGRFVGNAPDAPFEVKGPISGATVSRMWRSATGCTCGSPAGRSLWRLRRRARGGWFGHHRTEGAAARPGGGARADDAVDAAAAVSVAGGTAVSGCEVRKVFQ